MKELSEQSVARQALALGLMIAVVFGPALWVPFLYDDLGILSDPKVSGSWPGAWHWISRPLLNSGECEPLPTLLHRGLYAAASNHAPLYRLTSLILHWANAVLVLGLYRRLLGPKGPYIWMGVLFALFPCHVELMAVSTFKKHLLVSFFGLALVALHRDRKRGVGARWGLCAAALVAALLCKESAVILPVLCLIVDAASRDPRVEPRREAPFYAFLFSLCGLFLAWRMLLVPRHWGEFASHSGEPSGGSWALHLLTVGKTLLWFLSQMPFPFDLCLEHTLGAPVSLLSGEGFLIAAGLAGLAWLTWFLWRRDRVLRAAALWCMAALLPFLNILPVANLSLVADRYLYLASAGFFLGLGRLLDLWRQKGGKKRVLVGRGLCVAFALLYASAGMRYLALFGDPLQLWSRVAACAPLNPRAHAALGGAYRDRRRYPEAAEEFSRALSLSRSSEMTRMAALDLAGVYARSGRLGEAIALTEAQQRLKPTLMGHHNLGSFYLQEGLFEKALPELQAALRLAPEDASTLSNFDLMIEDLEALAAKGRASASQLRLLKAARRDRRQAGRTWPAPSGRAR